MAQQTKEAWYDAPSKPVTAFQSLDKESATPIEQPSFNMTKEEENSVLFLVGSRMASTGAHGIPNIQRASNIWRRLIWLLLFTGGVTVVVWQLTTIISNFFAYEVDVNINFVRDSAVKFPAITVCNLNPVPLSKADVLWNIASNDEDESSLRDFLPPPNPSGVMNATQNENDAGASMRVIFFPLIFILSFIFPNVKDTLS